MIKSLKKIYFGIIQRIEQFKYFLHKNNICVFMFHDVYVGDNEKPTLNISRDNFVNFIYCLQNTGQIVHVDKILEGGNDKKYVITFDDVREGAILHAVPILNKLCIPFTLFVSSCYVDKKGYITSAQIEELSKNPLCTIGFHTKNHKVMRGLKTDEIKEEIDCSVFEQKYGIKCKYFAYPYGSVYACSGKNIKILSKSNYKAAFGTINSATNSQNIYKNKFFVSRINVCDLNWKTVIKK